MSYICDNPKCAFHLKMVVGFNSLHTSAGWQSTSYQPYVGSHWVEKLYKGEYPLFNHMFELNMTLKEGEVTANTTVRDYQSLNVVRTVDGVKIEGKFCQGCAAMLELLK